MIMQNSKQIETLQTYLANLSPTYAEMSQFAVFVLDLHDTMVASMPEDQAKAFFHEAIQAEVLLSEIHDIDPKIITAENFKIFVSVIEKCIEIIKG